MSQMQQPKEKNSIDPIEAQAKFDAIHWAMNPQSERENRSYANVDGVVVFIEPTIVETYDRIDALFDAVFELQEYSEQEIPKPKCSQTEDPEAWIRYYQYLQRRKKMVFSINDSIRNESIHQWASAYNDLSVATRGQSNRAVKMLETIKDMGKAQFNPFQALGGMLGNRSEENMEFGSGGYPEDGAVE